MAVQDYWCSSSYENLTNKNEFSHCRNDNEANVCSKSKNILVTTYVMESREKMKKKADSEETTSSIYSVCLEFEYVNEQYRLSKDVTRIRHHSNLVLLIRIVKWWWNLSVLMRYEMCTVVDLHWQMSRFHRERSIFLCWTIITKSREVQFIMSKYWSQES